MKVSLPLGPMLMKTKKKNREKLKNSFASKSPGVWPEAAKKQNLKINPCIISV